MKTKFYINDEIFNDERHMPTLQDSYEYYEEHYRELGFTLDKTSEDVYIIYDKEYNLNTGDRVFLAHIYRFVMRKCLNIESNTIEFFLKKD
jgi:hypothetical protein